MAYNILTTDEMDELLDECVGYLLDKFKNNQSAVHLLSGIEAIYDILEDNPMAYPTSRDTFLKSREYHQAIVDGMDYIIIYKVAGNNVYILGIFHCSENYAEKMRLLWK